jgi:hypothetical protein
MQRVSLSLLMQRFSLSLRAFDATAACTIIICLPVAASAKTHPTKHNLLVPLMDAEFRAGARFTNFQEIFLTQILNAILNRIRIDS